jgi:hypothetical protein
VKRDNRGINLAFSFMLFIDYKCLGFASPHTSHVIAPANDELSILVAFPLSHNAPTWMSIGGPIILRGIERAWID